MAVYTLDFVKFFKFTSFRLFVGWFLQHNLVTGFFFRMSIFWHLMSSNSNEKTTVTRLKNKSFRSFADAMFIYTVDYIYRVEFHMTI